MAKQLAMVIDASKCIDCKACMLSCKAANKVPAGNWRNWVHASTPNFSQGSKTSSSFQPGGCMHCENPTCVTACPTGATFKNPETGEVAIDKSLCIGCGNCIPACPYDARYRHPELRTVDKCNYCQERRAAGLEPACVDTCPTRARVFGDINDPKSEAAILLKENTNNMMVVENAKTPTKPHMYYIGKTAPADWPREAVIPASMVAMTDVVNPLVKTITALSGVGVLAMIGRQLIAGADDSGHSDSNHKPEETNKEDVK